MVTIPISLLELEIPKFNGEFLSWCNFREVFVVLVHGNTSVSQVLKFQFLRNALDSGDAFHFIDEIPSTAVNYQKVWESLNTYYENDYRVKNIHISEIYYLESVSGEGPKELKLFIDKFNKHYNALSNLNIPIEHWDLYLVFPIMEKVDKASRREIRKEKTCR